VLTFPAWTNIELFLKSYRPRVEARGEQILFCGVITHLKGVDLLLQAFAEVRVKHPSATLKLAGKLEEGPFAGAAKCADGTIIDLYPAISIGGAR
jgi:glycosyltransferase involved in cell wall biosynthesis